MRKTIVLVVLMLVAAVSAFAEKQGVFMEYHRKSNPGTQTNVPRAPLRLPIDLVYDTESKCVTIIADESIEADVYVYNVSGTVVYYSSSVNTEFSIATGGYTVVIDGEDWYAKAFIEVD